jgi:hypothetical protein
VPTSIRTKDNDSVPVVLTDWEATEVSRFWRSALRSLADLQGRLTDSTDRLHNAGRHQVPADVVRFDYRHTGLTQDATQAEVAMVQLARVIDGAVHRTAEAHYRGQTPTTGTPSVEQRRMGAEAEVDGYLLFGSSLPGVHTVRTSDGARVIGHVRDEARGHQARYRQMGFDWAPVPYDSRDEAVRALIQADQTTQKGL